MTRYLESSKFERKDEFKILESKAPVRQLKGRFIVISLIYEELRMIFFLFWGLRGWGFSVTIHGVGYTEE